MNARVFHPGERVEFFCLTNSSILFRGVVERRLAAGLYMVTHDGEQKSRPVNGDRLRRPVSMFKRGGSAA